MKKYLSASICLTLALPVLTSCGTDESAQAVAADTHIEQAEALWPHNDPEGEPLPDDVEAILESNNAEYFWATTLNDCWDWYECIQLWVADPCPLTQEQIDAIAAAASEKEGTDAQMVAVATGVADALLALEIASDEDFDCAEHTDCTDKVLTAMGHSGTKEAGTAPSMKLHGWNEVVIPPYRYYIDSTNRVVLKEGPIE